MYGLKAFNLYMLVERERWQGCPITRHGTLRPDFASFYQRLTAFLKRYQFWQMERKPSVLVMLNYDMGRYAVMASTLNFAHADLYGLPSALFEVDLQSLGLVWDVAKEADDRRRDNWLGTVISWLDSHFTDYNLADTHLDPAHLKQYQVVCLPTVDFMDVADQEALLEYVQAGGQLVIGPGLPYLDPALQPARVFANYVQELGSTVSIGAGKLSWLGQTQVTPYLKELLPPPNFYCNHSAVDVVVQNTKECTLLFLANPTAAPIQTCLNFEGSLTLKAAWDGEQVLTGKSEIPLSLPAYTVQIMEVVRYVEN
jgi:beta-galactosidase